MKTFFHELGEFTRVVIISLLIVLPVRYFIAQPFIVRGASMEPNFYNGEYLIIDEASYYFNEPERGDVIVFRYPEDTSQFFIKRIVALPGERARVADGGVLLYEDPAGEGMRFEEEYIDEGIKTYPDVDVTLEEGEYFVLGDNRPFSSDSRRWGVLEEELIVGRAWVRLWPVAQAGLLR